MSAEGAASGTWAYTSPSRAFFFRLESLAFKHTSISAASAKSTVCRRQRRSVQEELVTVLIFALRTFVQRYAAAATFEHTATSI